MATTIRRKYILVIVILILLFIAGELVCRIGDLSTRTIFRFNTQRMGPDAALPYHVEDTVLMWKPVPSFRSEKIAINSSGFRDKSYSINKPFGTFRILCLGDLNTFGIAGIDENRLYHSLLEDRLTKEYRDTTIKVEVINGGVAGYSSYQGLKAYQTLGTRLKPEVVIAWFGPADLDKIHFATDKEIIDRTDPLSKSLGGPLYLASELIKYGAALIKLKSIGKNQAKTERVSPAEFKQNLMELDRLCRANGARLILILPPYCKTLDENGELLRMPEYIDALYRAADNNSIPVAMIPDSVKDDKQDYCSLFSGPISPNDKGHDLIMRSIYSAMFDTGLLPMKVNLQEPWM